MSHDNQSDPDVAYDLARDSIAHQLSAADGLDAKIATLIAVGCTLFGLVAALLAIKPLNDLIVLLVIISMTAPWLVLSLLALDAYQVVQFDACPELDQVFDDHDGKPVKQIKWTAADTLKKYFEKNHKNLKKKAKAVTVGLWCLVLETGIAVGWLSAIALGVDP